MNRKLFGIILLILGLMIVVFVNSLDFVRGKTFVFGPSQAVASVAGIFMAIFGCLIAFTSFSLSSLENFFSRCNHWCSKSIKPGTFDIAVIIGFAIFSTIYALGRWNGISPFIFLGSDASYISSYAASLDHPGQFAEDYYLSNQANVSSYFALHVPLIRFLNKLVGGYGYAFLVILPFALFFKLLGFYLVGKRLLKNRPLALLLAIATFPIVYTGAWDYWGLVGDALPRNLFDILFPWIVLWTIEWIDKPRRWYLLSFILGLMMYVHSISTGIIFLVICFVFLFQSKEPWRKRIGHLFVCAAIFGLTVLPFAVLHSSARMAAKSVSIDYQESLALINNQYGETRFNFLEIFVNLVKTLTISGILPLALLALLYLMLARRNKIKPAHRIIGAWILGVCIVTTVLPYIERLLDPWLHLVSVQMMLPRGLRYLPPLLVLFVLLTFFDKHECPVPRYAHCQDALAVILIAVSFGLTVTFNQQDKYALNELKCLASGHLTCPSQEELDAVDIIKALDTYTEPGDNILTAPPLSVTFTTSIRYQALRQLGYTKSDITRMSFDPVLQNQVATAIQPWNKLEHADKATLLAAYLSLAPSMQGDYLIVQLDDFPPESIQLFEPVYANNHYALYEAGN